MTARRVLLPLWVIMVVILVVVPGYGDRLPNETPENQIFSIDTLVDITGIMDNDMTQSWVLASPDSIPTGILRSRQSISDTLYRDNLMTNGGKLSLNKNYEFDSQNKKDGLFNIDTRKVLTYASTEGAHMVGEEEFTLSIAGNYGIAGDTVRCVFSTNRGGIVPAFCNIISAKSALININTAQVSTKGQSLTVAAGVGVPTTFNYQIAVSPDTNSGAGTAEGTVKTVFAGSIMEARDGGDSNYASSSPTWNKTAAENRWKDVTEVTGGIRNFRKALGDPSGFKSGILGPTDLNNDLSTTGTVMVIYHGSTSHSNDVTTYTLTGPGGSYSGSQSHTYTNMPAGHYSISQGFYPRDAVLTAGGIIAFTEAA